ISFNQQQESPFTFTVLHQLLHSFTQSYFALIEQIEDELEPIEDNTHDKKMNDLREDLFTIRKNLLHISYTTTPMKDMVSQLIDVDVGMNDTYKKQYFTRIYDRLLRLSEMVKTNREMNVDIRNN